MSSSAYFEGVGRTPTPVYMLDYLTGGQQLAGPALLIDNIRCERGGRRVRVSASGCVLELEALRALLKRVLNIRPATFCAVRLS
jgi:hypothetical protein